MRRGRGRGERGGARAEGTIFLLELSMPEKDVCPTTVVMRVAPSNSSLVGTDVSILSRIVTVNKLESLSTTSTFVEDIRTNNTDHLNRTEVESEFFFDYSHLT